MVCKSYKSASLLIIISIGLMSFFMLKIKYDEFYHIRLKEVNEALAIVSHCEDKKLLQLGGKTISDFCHEHSVTAIGNPHQKALKDTICFALPFMSILDRKTSESMMDALFENEKLFKIGVLILCVYAAGVWLGLFRFSAQQSHHNHTFVLPYDTSRKLHYDSMDAYGKKSKLM